MSCMWSGVRRLAGDRSSMLTDFLVYVTTVLAGTASPALGLPMIVNCLQKASQVKAACRKQVK